MTQSRSEWEPAVRNGRAPARGNGDGSGGAHSRPAAPAPAEPEGPEPAAPTSPRLAAFDGIRLKLRRAASGRYALGVDIELALDGEEDAPENEEALSAGEGDEDFASSEEDEGLAAAAGFARDGDDDAEEDDIAALGASDGDVDGDGQLALAGEPEEEALSARWPNQRPVVKGVQEISQAPALFDDSDDDAEEEPRAREATAFAADAAAPAVKRLLDEARKTIGLGEKPPGSNHNKITVWYNANIARIGNGPWCNMAVTYWAGLSSNLPAIFAGKKIGYAYTVAHAQKFKQKGRWHPGVAGIKSGDVVFFDWGGSRSIRNVDHVGVVEQVKGKKIITIEGNTSGDRCRRVVRDAKYIAGYGRPAYAA